MRWSLDRFIKAHPKLVLIGKGENRKNLQLVKKALDAIERRYPTREGDPPRGNVTAIQEEVAASRNETQSIYNFDKLKQVAKDLDFTNPNRMTRDGTKSITLHDKKLPTEIVKFLIFDLAHKVTKFSNLQPKLRKQVLKQAATVIFYDHGYKDVKGISNLDSTWNKRLDEAYLNGSDTNPLGGQHKGSKKYTDKLEVSNPGLTRRLFRLATKELGCQASYQELAQSMNRYALTIADAPATRYNTTNVWRWFKQQGGKEKSPMEKPFLTEDQKQKRKEWCVEQKNLMQEKGEDFHACFLDEKWFYTVSRRRRVKYLPAGDGEDANEVRPVLLTTLSRRHPIKVRDHIRHDNCCVHYIHSSIICSFCCVPPWVDCHVIISGHVFGSCCQSHPCKKFQWQSLQHPCLPN